MLGRPQLLGSSMSVKSMNNTLTCAYMRLQAHVRVMSMLFTDLLRGTHCQPGRNRLQESPACLSRVLWLAVPLTGSAAQSQSAVGCMGISHEFKAGVIPCPDPRIAWML